MSYASGFAQGELDAYKDRQNRVTREMTEDPRNDEERGYWDAYSPRSATWGALQHSPKPQITGDVPGIRRADHE